MKRSLLLPTIALSLAILACALPGGISPQDLATSVAATLTALPAPATSTPVPPTSVPSSATPAETPTETGRLAAGAISGSLAYPSEGIPPLHVVAFNLDTGETFYVDTEANQQEYTIGSLPPGTYHLVAYLGTFGGGYTQAVPCGLSVDCTDHSLIDVTVNAGETTTGVDPTDFYAPEGTFPPPPAPVLNHVEFEGITFDYAYSLAQSVRTESVPGVPPQTDGPYWDISPDHVEFTFDGYASINTYHQPRICVYPVEAFKAISPEAAQTIDGLAALLPNADSLQPGDPIPFLPIFNAGQIIRAQIKFFDFQNGRGVRFVTQYDQAPLPINNLELFYTFQGLTDDGQYYISAVLPVRSAALPDSDQVTPELMNIMADFEAYLAQTTEALNNSAPGGFTPGITLLDAMMESLKVK